MNLYTTISQISYTSIIIFIAQSVNLGNSIQKVTKLFAIILTYYTPRHSLAPTIHYALRHLSLHV